MPSPTHITQLFQQYCDGIITPEEYMQLRTALSQYSNEELAELLQPLIADSKTEAVYDEKWNHVLDDILAQAAVTEEAEEKVTPGIYFLHTVRKWWKVAAILLLISGGFAVYMTKQAQSSLPIAQAPAQKSIYRNDVQPGHDGARLKLADGSTVLIDSIADGLIAVQGKVKIYKKNGKIVYEGVGSEPVYNEITTDRGRQWSATLPDGTIVYLNAASSLRYPLNFEGDQRIVEMTGEAYFNVMHDNNRPFRVKIGNRQLVEDLGTEFNINAYDDEASIKTTLISGSASVITPQQKVILVPGEQASLADNNQGFRVRKENLALVTAWKNGFFSFHNADIQTVMRQLARWYNVEVEYSNGIPKQLFEGEFERSFSLATVLEILEKTKVHFKIVEDKKILILP